MPGTCRIQSSKPTTCLIVWSCPTTPGLHLMHLTQSAAPTPASTTRSMTDHILHRLKTPRPGIHLHAFQLREIKASPTFSRSSAPRISASTCCTLRS